MLSRALALIGMAPKGPLDPAAFTAKIVTATAAAHPQLTVEAIGPLAFTVRTATGGESQDTNLEKFYELYCDEPVLLDALVKLQVSAQGDLITLATAQVSADMVVPLVRSFRDLEGFDETSAIIDPLTTELAIVYAFDLPHTLQYLTPRSLEVIGVSREDLAAVALANIEQRSAAAHVELEDGIAFITADGFSASSLILCDAFWRTGVFAGSPCIAAFVPDRELVIAVDATEHDSVADGLALAQAHAKLSSTRLSAELIMVRSDKIDVPAGGETDAEPTPSVASRDAAAT
jgi:hypothetical protein